MSRKQAAVVVTAGALLGLWLPVLGVLALAGLLGGWKLAASLVAAVAVVVFKALWALARLRRGARPAAWPVQILLFAALGAALGWFALGAAGAAVGAGLGFSVGLPMPAAAR